MEKQKLLVEMKIDNGISSIKTRCPNEDDEISITIINKYKPNSSLRLVNANKSTYSFTLTEAKDFADFIINHVNNAIESNK